MSLREHDLFVASNEGSAGIKLSFPTVTVQPLRPGRRNTEAERQAQRKEILAAALRSVEEHGAIGLQPEKVVGATGGSITSQSMRRAFRTKIEVDGSRRSLRDVLEHELLNQQLDLFDQWLRVAAPFEEQGNEKAMIQGLGALATGLLRNQALTRLRSTDRGRLESFLCDPKRSAKLVEALTELAMRCLTPGSRPPRRERVHQFVTENLRLLADDVALLRLERPAGAESFVKLLKDYASK